MPLRLSLARLSFLLPLSLLSVGRAEPVEKPLAPLPDHVWLEAETFGPLRGGNFSFQAADKQQAGAWAIAGPGVADAWTQGGESEGMSVAARAAEDAELMISREAEIPAAGSYTLWVRYADYREKQETFGVRIRQGERMWEHIFGTLPMIDELDPMKLLWDWSFAWDSAVEIPLQPGRARIELFTPGRSQARRQVDCLCLTTDLAYHPHGREKPDFAAWRTLRAMREAGLPAVEPFATPASAGDVPAAWRIAKAPPAFLWNVGAPWAAELAKPAAERVDEPFGVDEPLLKDFLAAHRGRAPLIYSDPLSGPVWHIPQYPSVFASGSPFLDWLARHPDRPFALLLNYGNPAWPKGADRAAVRANLQRFGDRFAGYISGESLSHTDHDNAALETKVRAAKSRAEVLAALREVHTDAVIKKFTDYYGAPMAADAAWADVIPCLSANDEAYCHALAGWGVKRIGHENTGNSPNLARRLAFLRGAARQFGRQIADYQSCNLGDAATMFSRQAFFYPASSRYVLDNSYDAFAGAGVNWLWKDYVLWHLAGTSAFYNEQGVDLFWKPGGGSAGDEFPVQLSPKGKVAEAALRLAHEHPRGTQYTPIAFLVDEAHGWSQERFTPGAFGLDVALNPAVLTPGQHEASLRAWFDVAWFPAPETQNEPANAVRQTYVNGMFGDIFDVIASAPGREAILSTYRVVIVAGEAPISMTWGRALAAFVENGGTLVTCAAQLTGEGVPALALPALDAAQTASAFTWQPDGAAVRAQTFRFHSLAAAGARVLATAPTDEPIALLSSRGKGRLITIGVPFGLALDERPTPLLALVMRHVTEGLLPVRATGDVEWIVNQLDDGRWLLALLNNRGVEKPQHGIVPTRHEEAQSVKLDARFAVEQSREWQTGAVVAWEAAGPNATTRLSVPAGAVRFIEITPRR